MHLRLARRHFPITVLGPGRRVGLWFQGCTIGCPACMSRDTWAVDGGTPTTVDEVVEWALPLLGGDARGVTISGGEPFQQPQALELLLTRLSEWRDKTGKDIDVLCYSGYPMQRLRRSHGSILALLDALIPGPFVPGLVRNLPWRGSDNQPLVPLTPRGQRLALELPDPDAPRLQIVPTEQGLAFFGVPEPDQLRSITDALAARGVRMEGLSWD